MDIKTHIMFIQKTLRALEKNLRAPEKCLLFLSAEDLRVLQKGLLYFRPAFGLEYEQGSGEGSLYHFALCSRTGKTESNLLLCRTVDSLTEVFTKSVRIQGDKVSFFSPRHFVDEDSEVAALVSEILSWLYKSLEIFYEQALGFRFAAITAVAERAYEKDAALGKIILYSGPDDFGNICCPQMQDGPTATLRVENARLIRRLLAGAGQSSLLFIRTDSGLDEYCFKGYLKADALSDVSIAVTEIEIDGKGAWTFSLANRKVFSVKGNRAYMPPRPLETMNQVVTATLGPGFDNLLPSLDALSQQRHGTSVVLLNLDVAYIKNWMQNLVQCGRAFCIKPISLNVEEGQTAAELEGLLKSISRIDGAIIVDYPTMEIRYISVIVDGKAVPGGMPDAGARHNALYGFIQNLKEAAKDEPDAPPALAFIFSEDGELSYTSTVE